MIGFSAILDRVVIGFSAIIERVVIWFSTMSTTTIQGGGWFKYHNR